MGPGKWCQGDDHSSGNDNDDTRIHMGTMALVGLEFITGVTIPLIFEKEQIQSLWTDKF